MYVSYSAEEGQDGPGGGHRTMKRWIPLILPLVGVVIFILILRGIGFANLVETFRTVDRRGFLFFPVFTLFIVLMRGLRWQYLMGLVGIRYPLWRASLVWAIGFFAGAVTPGKVGDAMRGYYLSRDANRNFAESFATVVVDRLMDLVALLVFGVISVILFSYYYTELPSVWIVFVAVVVIIGLIYLMLHRQAMRKLARPVFRLITPPKYQAEMSQHFHSFYDSVGVYLREWRRASLGLVYTVAFWLGVAFLALVVARMLSIETEFGYLCVMLPMIALVEIIPISVAGLGTRDAAVIYLFSIVGVGSSQALGFSLLYMFAGTYLLATVGLVAWLFRPALLRQASRE